MGYLAFEIIEGALEGDEMAMEAVLNEYEAYITELSTFNITDSYGRIRKIVSEDAKQEIREKLVSEMSKLRGIKK
jgi:hypothetical protein